MGRRPTLPPLYAPPPPPPGYWNPEVFLSGRAGGKTTQALLWVQRGVRVKGYPGWSRVLLMPNVQLEVGMRTWAATPEAIAYAEQNHDPILADMEQPRFDSWWSCIPDWSHRVYDYRTWAESRHASRDTEVRIDEINMLWSRIFDVPGRVTGFTMTGTTWEPEDD